MNLYAILPTYAPSGILAEFVLAETDADAMDAGIHATVNDQVHGFDSPNAAVYLVAADLRKIGEAQAADASPAVQEWADWARRGGVLPWPWVPAGKRASRGSGPQIYEPPCCPRGNRGRPAEHDDATSRSPLGCGPSSCQVSGDRMGNAG